MSHDHDHHDHDHGHGHEHDHAKDSLAELKSSRAQTPPPEVPQPAVVEESGTQALSEALQSSFLFVKILVFLLLVGLVLSCIRTVQSNQVAVILRFGKPQGSGPQQILKPGAHFVLPYPIDELVTIPVGESHTVESTIGWPANTAIDEIADRETTPNEAVLKPGVDGYTLTADGNVIHARVTLKYRIQDPLKYGFDFANITNVLKNILDNALLHASMHSIAEDALYKDKAGFRDKVYDRVATAIEKAGLGITLEPINVETRANHYVRASFAAVSESENERSTKISAAQGDAALTLERAQGEANTILNAGIVLSNQVVQAVAADSRYFLDQLPHYQKDPELFKKRLIAMTMERVLTNATDKFFLPASSGKPSELRLQLSREPEKPKSNLIGGGLVNPY